MDGKPTVILDLESLEGQVTYWRECQEAMADERNKANARLLVCRKALERIADTDAPLSQNDMAIAREALDASS